MRTRPLIALAVLTLALSGCDSLSSLLGTENKTSDSLALTQAALTGKILSFTPDNAAGGIDNWEYYFRSGYVYGCNREATYQSTGWTVIDDQTVKVHFGNEWEQYKLVNSSGTLADGDLSGRFELSSSPGISMSGSFSQVTALSYCQM